jgi:hypothetical protein
MKKLFSLGLGVLMAAAVVLAAVNITGQWDMTTKMPNGQDRTSVISFVQDGEKLTVKTTGRNGEEITGTGTVKGNDVEWTITRTTPRGEMTITYKAKVDGDKMTGSSQVGDRPGMEFTAVKKAK